MVSVRERFAMTVGANLIRALLSFTTGMLIARWLGPESYGNMAFMLGTFLGVRHLLDLGTSSAFFTFLSQRRRSVRFARSFYGWLTIQFVLPSCAIAIVLPDAWITSIWHGAHRPLVLLAFAAVFMQHTVWGAVQQAGEAERRTAFVQAVSVALIAVHLLAMVLLWRLDMLGLYAIFAVVALEYLFASLVVHRGLVYLPSSNRDLTASRGDPTFKEYLRYCAPLIPYAIFSFVYEFGDRWLLQNYGGSVEQAYYGVAAQFSGIALIATSSILRIFWKEIAEAHHKGDSERTEDLYRKISRLLFLIGSMIAGFLMPWSEDLLRAILGVAYVAGAPTLGLMFLYPVHQSMGQIGGTMLLATGKVSLYVVSGIVFMAVSVATAYLVLAPGHAAIPGWGLGSIGLASKMVAMQLIQVNVIAYVIAKTSGWSFDWAYQPVSLVGCVLAGLIAHSLVESISAQSLSLGAQICVGAGVYGGLIAALIYAVPFLTGFSRKELTVAMGGFARFAALRIDERKF